LAQAERPDRRLTIKHRWRPAVPQPGSSRYPTDKKFDSTGWVKSKVPKTTIDDPAVLLREGEDAWQSWIDAGARPTGSGFAFSSTSKNGVEISGFFVIEDGTRFPKTIFVEASWF
jgi:hypothetical protein